MTAGTPVRKSGIRIGEVESIRLADDDSSVIVTVLIQEGQEHLQGRASAT